MTINNLNSGTSIDGTVNSIYRELIDAVRHSTGNQRFPLVALWVKIPGIVIAAASPDPNISLSLYFAASAVIDVYLLAKNNAGKSIDENIPYSFTCFEKSILYDLPRYAIRKLRGR
jgi:hypothetical protein